MKPKLRGLKDIPALKGKRVALRLDLNVPMDGGKILDETRIEKALPTLRYLREAGAKTVVLSHLGSDGEESLEEVARRLGERLPAGFMPKTTGPDAERATHELRDGGILVLENLRSDPGEKGNSTFFAMALSKLGDFYVNDAFAASHRAHASVVSLPKFLPGYAGLQFEREVKELSRSFRPKRPFLFILGGAKFSTKLPLIKRYLGLADKIFVGGAIMNSFFKAKGYETGKSLADSAGEDLKALLKDKKLMLPTDVLVNDGETRGARDVGKNDIVRDIGPASLAKLLSFIGESKEILFNGPLGAYELGFDKTTEAALQAMAKKGVRSVVGGGDTATIVGKLGMEKKLSFVSTGGGAMIEFLSNGTLPGIEALKKQITNS
ncbi:MAG: phosphoglycerate kinase [bacterium]|nr:phosphoglycerate kinase [bacterium]